MSTMTLSGREAPSTKRIDVEANLLQDWLVERREIRKQIQLRIVGILGITFLGVFGVSQFTTAKAKLALSHKPLQQRLKNLQAQYAEVAPQEAAGGTSPADIQKMIDQSKSYGDAYMGQLVALLNSASPSMAFSSLKQDVLGGEVKITGQADAETNYTANEFIQRNTNPAKNMNAIMVSTSRSDVLAMDGVSFQFVKKVRVTQ